jgi:hypothetical protein
MAAPRLPESAFSGVILSAEAARIHRPAWWQTPSPELPNRSGWPQWGDRASGKIAVVVLAPLTS